MEYMPEVIQVIPTSDYTVYVYFDDGSIKLYDAHNLIKQGIFTALQDINEFKNCCTVLNGTLVWDLEGNYDESKCLDIDTFEIYDNCIDVDEPIEMFKSKGVRPMGETGDCNRNCETD